MKTILKLALISSLAIGSATWADSHKHKEGKEHKRPSPEQRVEKMTKKLSLSQEQADEILKVMQAHQKEAEVRRAENKARRMAAQEEIQQILTDEQQAKYSKMHDKMKNKKGMKHGDCDHDDE
jgi:Spy/CpxP family protein refolding chaperone